MLNHFPTPYPEETFYSVLCRYYISTGIREMATVDRELFGGKNGSSICTLYPNRTMECYHFRRVSKRTKSMIE